MKATEFLRAAEAWPLEGLEALLPEAGPVLLLSPHPDDESLGCGGLLAQLAARGREVRVVLVSDGAASHDSRLYPPRRLAALRQEEMAAALAALGLGPERLVTLGLPDG
ncbi:PIG-L family deacetylase, partial [Roseomonas sp. DSM 102946]|nr:PIG-L family deacetylase [Roseomonas sp. DSM 102946]